MKKEIKKRNKLQYQAHIGVPDLDLRLKMKDKKPISHAIQVS
jgi:uncharacterized radical SAM superfamily protein